MHLWLVVVHVVARAQQKELCGDHIKIEEALLLKFKYFLRKRRQIKAKISSS
jgi:hypothetical protein